MLLFMINNHTQLWMSWCTENVTHLGENPPLKEVSAEWRTEDVVRFTSLEAAQHPSDLTQVFDRSPFEGRFRIFASIFSPNLGPSPKPFVFFVVKTIPSLSGPTLVLSLTLGRETP